MKRYPGPELRTVLLISGKYNSLGNAVRSVLGKNSQTKNLIDKLSGLEVDSLEMEKLRRENDDMRQILEPEKSPS